VNDLLDALHSFAGISMSTPEVGSFLQQVVAAAATVPGAHPDVCVGECVGISQAVATEYSRRTHTPLRPGPASELVGVAN
jgi:hypothetical protein